MITLLCLRQLLDASAALADVLRARVRPGETVAFLCPRDHTYPVTQWAIWRWCWRTLSMFLRANALLHCRCGGIAVPLSPQSPQAELAYYLEDAGAAALIAHESLRSNLPQSSAPVVNVASSGTSADCVTSRAAVAPDRYGRPLADALALTRAALADGTSRALMTALCSSTPRARPVSIGLEYNRATCECAGKPKGVLHTHGTLAAQMAMLEAAWGWTENDRILSVLPLHHVHGIVNVLVRRPPLLGRCGGSELPVGRAALCSPARRASLRGRGAPTPTHGRA